MSDCLFNCEFQPSDIRSEKLIMNDWPARKHAEVTGEDCQHTLMEKSTGKVMETKNTHIKCKEGYGVCVCVCVIERLLRNAPRAVVLAVSRKWIPRDRK